MTGQSLEATAHHEAGHQVINYHLDLGIGSTTIVPDNEKATAGTALGENPWFDGSRDADYIV